MGTRTFWAGVAVVVALVAALPVAAQTREENRSAYNTAFQETLRKPADLPALQNFVRLAVAVEDFEGAISAYERFLIFDADQPRLKFELGRLYYRLRSWEAARVYFEGARSSARASAELKVRSTEFIEEIDRRWGKSIFTGEFVAGLRYSDNPNSVPIGTLRSLGGPTIVPSPVFTRRNDWSAVGGATVKHRYDFGRQDNGTMETDLSFYTARQFQVSDANVLLTDLTVGPRMEMTDGSLRGLSLKPFMTGRYVSVHDQPTYWAWGAGLETAVPVGDMLRAAATVIGRRREFVANADVPSNPRSSGNDAAGTFELRAELTPSVLAIVGGNFTRYLAQIPSESYTEAGFGGLLTVRFVDPLGVNGRKWYVTGNAGLQFATYDQPDPIIEPTITRSQTDLNLGFLLAIPLDDRTTLIGQTIYSQRAASINNFSYNTVSGLLGVGWRF